MCVFIYEEGRHLQKLNDRMPQEWRETLSALTLCYCMQSFKGMENFGFGLEHLFYYIP